LGKMCPLSSVTRHQDMGFQIMKLRTRLQERTILDFFNVYAELTMSLIMNTLYLFTHSAVCLTTSPKRVLHTVQSSASSFDFYFPFFSLRPSSSCPSNHPRLSVILSFPPSFVQYRVSEGSFYASCDQSS
jgi:hypothetical protein